MFDHRVARHQDKAAIGLLQFDDAAFDPVVGGGFCGRGTDATLIEEGESDVFTRGPLVMGDDH
ncbi:MAG: hypothetical protein QM796_11495 [Chthoniobacteraceae bacterium]